MYDHSQDLALLIVEAEDTADKPGEGEGEGEGPGGFLKEELLLSARVEKEDIYARQQGTLRSNLTEIFLTARYSNRLDGALDTLGHCSFVSGSRRLRRHMAVHHRGPTASEWHAM